MTEVVVDNGKAFVSEESATIATEAAAQAKQWAEESERQANIATTNADTAVDAKELAEEWAKKTDGLVDNTDYSAKAYAIGGTGTETNNAKYYSQQAGNSANIAYQAKDEAVNVVNGFTQRVTEATNTFNSNATAKTNAFNDNYTEKKALIDAQVEIAESSATNANNYKNKSKEWAVSQNIVDNEDYSSKYWAGKSKEWAESVSSPVNKNLSNLNPQGQNIANWSTNVTNCITEIPQDINLELNNGTITLKAGSKVYVPNGVGVFDVVTVPSDVVFHTGTVGSSTLDLMLCCNLTGGFGIRADPSFFVSGSTEPSNTSLFWYDTVNNMIKAYVNGVWVQKYSFPIGIYHRENGNAVAVKKVFNGFGYIGSAVFALPGVKGLMPNGINADGSLKNREHTIPSVRVATSNYTANDILVAINSQNIHIMKKDTWIYNEKTNYFENTSGGKSLHFYIAECVLNSGTISQFNPKKVFRIPEYQNENINVKNFGAKGDGTTDDTEAFAQAINASTQGGTITVPFGNYKLSSNPDDNTKNLNWDIANGTNFSGVAGQTAADNNYRSFSTPYLTNPYIKAGGYKERVGLDILSPVGGGVCATIYELEGRPYSETTITGTITSGSAVMTNVSGNLSAIHKGNIIHSTISGWPDSNNRGVAMRVVSVDENTNTITFGNTPETRAIPGDGWVKATAWNGATQTTTFTIRPRNWQVLHYDGVTTGTVDNVDDFYYCFNSVMNITGTNGHLAEYDLNLLNETRDFSIGLLLTGIGDEAAPCKGIEINRGGGQNWTTGIDIKNCQYGIGITAYQPILIRTNFYDNISKQNLISLNGIMFDNFTDYNNMFRPILGAGQLFDNTTCIALSRYSDSNPTGYFFRGRTKTNLTDVITIGTNGNIYTTGGIYAKDYRIGQTPFTQTVNCNKTITLFDKDNNPFYVPCYQNV